jgi:hypothetical protein
MRSIGLTWGLLLLGTSACSLLLDTASLQKGDGGHAADAMPEADAPSDAGKSCTSDIDCVPPDLDGCMIHTCAADGGPKTCNPPTSNSGGLGITVAGSIETVLTADDIGYPSLLADGSDFVMAVWHKSGTTTDVLVRKYPAYPQAPGGAELSAIAPGMFRSYASSPGLVTRVAVPRKVRFLLAADLLGDADSGTGMRLVDIDVPSLNNNLKLSATQPTPADLGIGGYDTRARAFPPRMMPNGVMEPVGMWIQQQKLFYFDGASAREAFSAKHVLGFSPLFATTGVHAALETSDDVDGGPGTDRTELWSDGSATLISLDGDQPGARRGVSSTFTNESNANANFVAWAFEPKNGVAAWNYAGALCGGPSCASAALPGQQTTIPAMFPELASNRVTGSMIDRDIVQTFQVVIPDMTQATMATTVLFAGASRFTIPSADLTKGSTKEMNPPLFVVDAASGPMGLAPGEIVGPSSVAVTSDGQVLIAWVVRPTPSTAVLKARRFLVKTCP